MKRERRNCSDQRDLTLSVALRVAVKTYLSDRNLSEVYLSVTARRAAKLRFPRLSSPPPPPAAQKGQGYSTFSKSRHSPRIAIAPQ